MFHREICVADGQRRLHGVLTLPPGATSLALVVGGSSEGRSGSEARVLASHFELAGLGTLVVGLLAPEEVILGPAASGSQVNDLLALRVLSVVSWLKTEPATRRLRVGICGFESGGAAALTAAVLRPETVEAVVCISGRPDLLGSALAHVTVGTLLVVRETDEWLVDANRRAFDLLRCDKELVVLPAETEDSELMAELHEAADLGIEWFTSMFALVAAE